MTIKATTAWATTIAITAALGYGSVKLKHHHINSNDVIRVELMEAFLLSQTKETTTPSFNFNTACANKVRKKATKTNSEIAKKDMYKCVEIIKGSAIDTAYKNTRIRNKTIASAGSDGAEVLSALMATLAALLTLAMGMRVYYALSARKPRRATENTPNPKTAQLS